MADSRPRLEAELASTEAQLRDTETGLNHYLRSFETGEMPAAICSPRVTELTQRRDELAAHRKKLACQIEAASPQLPTPDQLRALCAEIRRTIDSGNPDAVKQLLRELIDRVEITPERHAYPYFWVPAGCETGTPSGKPGPDAPPVPAHQGDTGWLFMANRGGGGNRTRVLRLLVGPSPSAADRRLSRTPLLSAAAASRIRQRVPAGQPEQPTSELHSMTPDHQPMEQRLGGRRYCLSSVRELRLGVCFVFRLFNVAPETTARFSQLDYRSRDLSPPCVGTAVRSDDLALCPNAPLSLPRRRRGSFGPAPAVLSRARSSAARCGAPSRSPARLRG